MTTIPESENPVPRTSAQILAEAQRLSAKGYDDHEVGAALGIDVTFARQLIGLPALLKNRHGR